MAKQKSQANKPNYAHVPHFELIKENEEIHIPSIFMFESGTAELFSFFCACRAYGCSVVFENEGITVSAKERADEPLQNLLITLYASISENPKIAEDYIRYRENISEMNWDKVK